MAGRGKKKKLPTDAAIDALRAWGLKRFPGAHTKSPWPGHLDLAVKDKTFAYLSIAGEPFSVSCKLPRSNEKALMLPGVVPTGYGLGKSGWVTATFADKPPLDLLKEWIEESYRAQAPKKLLAVLDALPRGAAVLALCVFGAAALACSPAEDDDEQEGGPQAPIVTWTFDGAVHLLFVGEGPAQDVSAELPRAQRAPDRWLVPSPQGVYAALSADLGTGDGEVLVRARLGFLDETEVVRPGGVPVYLEGMPAIVDEGDAIVFAQSGGPHALDLFRTDRIDDSTWTAPLLLTAASAFENNNQPSLSRDGARVLFNCGDNRDPESGNNSACAVDLAGGTVDVLVAPDTLPDGRNSYVNFPRDAGDGRVVFEGSWPQGEGDPPETLWQRTGTDAPTPAVSRTFDNTVSPCVLGDGSIVALWLGREGGSGVHELTHIKSDGTFTSLLPDVDVDDIGIGCTSR